MVDIFLSAYIVLFIDVWLWVEHRVDQVAQVAHLWCLYNLFSRPFRRLPLDDDLLLGGQIRYWKFLSAICLADKP